MDCHSTLWQAGIQPHENGLGQICGRINWSAFCAMGPPGDKHKAVCILEVTFYCPVKSKTDTYFIQAKGLWLYIWSVKWTSISNIEVATLDKYYILKCVISAEPPTPFFSLADIKQIKMYGRGLMKFCWQCLSCESELCINTGHVHRWCYD